VYAPIKINKTNTCKQAFINSGLLFTIKNKPSYKGVMLHKAGCGKFKPRQIIFSDGLKTICSKLNNHPLV
jgi:hypothetical protein